MVTGHGDARQGFGDGAEVLAPSPENASGGVQAVSGAQWSRVILARITDFAHTQGDPSTRCWAGRLYSSLFIGWVFDLIVWWSVGVAVLVCVTLGIIEMGLRAYTYDNDKGAMSKAGDIMVSIAQQIMEPELAGDGEDPETVTQVVHYRKLRHVVAACRAKYGGKPPKTEAEFDARAEWIRGYMAGKNGNTHFSAMPVGRIEEFSDTLAVLACAPSDGYKLSVQLEKSKMITEAWTRLEVAKEDPSWLGVFTKRDSLKSKLLGDALPRQHRRK